MKLVKFNDKPSRLAHMDPKVVTDERLDAWMQSVEQLGEMPRDELKFLHEQEYRTVMKEIVEHNVTTAQVLALARHLHDEGAYNEDQTPGETLKEIAYLDGMRKQPLADILRAEHERGARGILLRTMSWLENMEEWKELGYGRD
jgi:hypothetical protein